MSRPDNKQLGLMALTGLAEKSVDDLEQVWLETVTSQSGDVSDLYSAMFALSGVDNAYDWLLLQGMAEKALPDMWDQYWLSVVP
jgi:hypothetical protein